MVDGGGDSTRTPAWCSWSLWPWWPSCRRRRL